MTTPDFDRIMKEKIFAKHPELRQMVPLKLNGYPAMSPLVGVVIYPPVPERVTDVKEIVFVYDKGLREEARALIKQYAPQRWCDDSPHGVLCLVWIQ